MGKVLEIINLKKYYGKSKGVENISFNVNKGEVFGLIGPNGAGKSTTIRAILGLIKKTSGEIKVFGEEIEGREKDIRKRIGYLPSECNFYGDMRVKELLKYSQELYKNKEVKIEDLAERLQLDLNKKIEDLSYGNRKKVGIIDTLLSNGDLFIFDEATGGLDPLIQEEFFKILEQLKFRGKTIIYSAHVLSEVQRLCDRVGIIKNGNLIKVDEIDSLREINFKRVSLITENINIKNIDNIWDYKESNGRISFNYSGDDRSLLKEILIGDFNDLTIENPTLEEVFLKYYEREI
ncbi:ABC transporter ATP-binding protein [Clostridium frigidicarnis]|uniref:ABC-2 type transport system ATP-binding protein n=1 Tax=Clostridium frigidicarnis TaxID=84698 RepID=A0A1I0WT14_9CLOT|nr:ABC transporter ATP-binding protein [Clostridium frigidicarnis]SFA91567.1 ABC-2 type transport system ATP-binding protein [Clostridium frigidicarnis]